MQSLHVLSNNMRVCRGKLRWSLLCFLSLISLSVQSNDSVVNDLLIKQILTNYSNASVETINFAEFSQLYADIVDRNPSNFPQYSKDFTECFTNRDSKDAADKVFIENCILSKVNKSCMSPGDLYDLYSLSQSQSLTAEELENLSVGILYSVQQGFCHSQSDSHHHNHLPSESPSSSAVWGYGFLCVTIINLCSLVGVIVLPFMKMAIYRVILIFMVALACGSLAGSGLLFLIPRAFGFDHDDTGYIFKSTTVIGGIYLFYLTERIMKMLMIWREKRLQDNADKRDIFCTIRRRTPLKSESEMKDPSHIPNTTSSCTATTLLDDFGTDGDITEVDVIKVANGDFTHPKSNGNSGHHHGDKKHPIATVAWMIIFGDGLHNFIDGLSIGAAFTNSILSGISVSLACICEELPHELGDFAILLNAGMKLKQALMYNFLSACMCYLGLIVGVLLGENTTANAWVFAVAGGMFLYIALVDMMPEMNSAAESEEAQKYGTVKIFILQNFGLAVGFFTMFAMALYGGNISFE